MIKPLQLIFLVLLCNGAALLSAQTGDIALEVVGSAGGFEQSNAGSFSYTVGEVVTEYVETNAGSSSQGFQQVFEALLLGSLFPFEASIMVFPNPASDRVHLRGVEGMHLRLYDIQSRLISERGALADSELLDLNGLPQGIYLLEFFNNESDQHKIVKLIKY